MLKSILDTSLLFWLLKHVNISLNLVILSSCENYCLFVNMCCATNRKVAGSNPAGVSEFFIDIKNPSDRTMALGSTQPLTEMSTRSISWG